MSHALIQGSTAATWEDIQQDIREFVTTVGIRIFITPCLLYVYTRLSTALARVLFVQIGKKVTVKRTTIQTIKHETQSRVSR